MKIKVVDEFPPEDTAMMQALYSRSAESVDKHIEKVKTSGSGKFLERYYVQYGHQSIADCGSTTVFIEDVSILAAKAIQDWPLYRGQETSTRYIDMSKQRIHDPLNTVESNRVLNRWMEFYFSAQEPLAKHLKVIYPIKNGENLNIYEKAIKARVFDVLRGFLPAGVCTQLSWHTDLRQAADKLSLLKYHPLQEVRDIAHSILNKLKEKYTSSFSHKEYSETEAYRQKLSQNYSYVDPDHEFLTASLYPSKMGVSTYTPRINFPDSMGFTTTIDKTKLALYTDILTNRPVKTGLPQFLAELGTCTFEFPLDFGSFRDLQRHRNGICRMPLLTVRGSFHNWYLDEMPEDLKNQAKILLEEQTLAISQLNCSKEDLQYFVAMGFLVSCKVTYGLPAAVYVIELRSGKTVHPTLRRAAQSMGSLISNSFGEDLKLHIDDSLDDWDIRRGSQDILEKHDINKIS